MNTTTAEELIKQMLDNPFAIRDIIDPPIPVLINAFVKQPLIINVVSEKSQHILLKLYPNAILHICNPSNMLQHYVINSNIYFYAFIHNPDPDIVVIAEQRIPDIFTMKFDIEQVEAKVQSHDFDGKIEYYISILLSTMHLYYHCCLDNSFITKWFKILRDNPWNAISSPMYHYMIYYYNDAIANKLLLLEAGLDITIGSVYEYKLLYQAIANAAANTSSSNSNSSEYDLLKYAPLHIYEQVVAMCHSELMGKMIKNAYKH